MNNFSFLSFLLSGLETRIFRHPIIRHRYIQIRLEPKTPPRSKLSLERRTEFEELAQRFYALYAFESTLLFHNFARQKKSKKDPTPSRADPSFNANTRVASRKKKANKNRRVHVPRAINRIRLSEEQLEYYIIHGSTSFPLLGFRFSFRDIPT